MMVKMARLSGQEVIAALKKAGFEVLRTKGSHHFLGIQMAGGQLSLCIAVKSLVQG